MASWSYVDTFHINNGTYLIKCDSVDSTLQLQVYEGRSPDLRHYGIWCLESQTLNPDEMHVRLGSELEYQQFLDAVSGQSGSGETTQTGLDEFGNVFISEFQPWVVESLVYALIVGLGMGWAGSFLYRRLRG